MKKIMRITVVAMMLLYMAGCEDKENRLVSITDKSLQQGVSTACALEWFYEDEQYNYSFPSIRSQLIECTFADGTVMNVTEALNANLIVIDDLNRFNIFYYKTDKNGNIISSQGENRKMLLLQVAPYLYYETEPLNERNDLLSLSFEKPDELPSKPYSPNLQLKPYADYLKEKYDVDVNENFIVSVHYYDERKNSGSIEFQYTIGEIITNRYATFSIMDGKFKRIFHYGLNKTVDEEKLLARVKTFKDTYIQQGYELKENEQFIEENVRFSYNYQSDELMYDYSVAFKQADGNVNREYGTVCLIDDNGYAITNEKY